MNTQFRLKHFAKLLGLVASFVFILSAGSVAQIINRNTSCEENASILSEYLRIREAGSTVIFVGRQGFREGTSRYTKTRLAAIERMLFARSDTKPYVFAFGKRSDSKPKVEVYINGKLELIFEIPEKKNLEIVNCGD